MVQASDGNFYGTTMQGGDAGGYGTVFKLTPAGVLTAIHSFGVGEGQAPQGALIQGVDGNFYGVTYSGGPANAGTIFKLTPSGTLTTLHFFQGSDGSHPSVGLVQGSDGSFYGTTRCGGPSSTCNGTIFKITSGGTFTTLHFLSNSEGNTRGQVSILVQGADGNFYGTTTSIAFRITPSGAFTTLTAFGDPLVYAGLTPGNDGNFYGVTENGGTASVGSVFKMTPAGVVTTLYSMGGSDSKYPVADLVLGPDGNFYGTTGGDHASDMGFPITDHGSVFRITPDGSFTTLHVFNNGDGSGPTSALTLGSDGKLYGGTQFGGASNSGTLFQITTAGAFNSLFSFTTPLGANPRAPLLIGEDGGLYGTAENGGTGGGFGTVFRVTTGGSGSALHSFDMTDGWLPFAGLVLGSDHNFYGTTRGDDEGFVIQNPQGSVFRLAPNGAFTSLHSFTGNDGANPGGALVEGANGSFYGTTAFGGTNTAGTVFSITPAGSLTTLHNFDLSIDGGDATAGLLLASDGNFYGATDSTIFRMTPSGSLTTLHNLSPSSEGSSVTGALVQGADGNFYGTAQQQGASGRGSVFRVTPSGTLTILHSFSAAEASVPTGALVAGNDGNFYGITQPFGSSTGGTLFRISPAGTLTTLHQFSNQAGLIPQGGLVLNSDGYLYGTTSGGGDAGIGTVYRLLPPPATPTGLTAAAGDAHVNLSWNAAVGAATYNVLQGTAAGGESATPVLTGITGTSVNVTGLINGTTYYYKVESVNAGGISLPSNEAIAKPVGPPVAPTNLSATAGDGKISLGWNAVAGAASYNVYQGTVAGGESAAPVRSGLTGTSINITGLSDGTTYYFFVRARNAGGISPASNEASGTPLGVPTALSAKAGDRSASLQWTAAPGAATYNVYQGTAAGGESAAPVQSGLTGTSTNITGLTNGTTYYFVVRARNASGISATSNEASATPQPPAPPAPGGVTATIGDRQVSLSWNASAGAATYNVYQGTVAGGESAAPVRSGLTGTSVNITGLSDGTTYYFFVRARNAGGISPASNEASGTPLGVPTALSAKAGDRSASLQWTAAPGAATYNVYQGTAAGGESTAPVRSGLTGTSISITGLSNGTAYYFVVRARNTSGISATSNEASATPGPPPPAAAGHQ